MGGCREWMKRLSSQTSSKSQRAKRVTKKERGENHQRQNETDRVASRETQTESKTKQERERQNSEI